MKTKEQIKQILQEHALVEPPANFEEYRISADNWGRLYEKILTLIEERVKPNVILSALTELGRPRTFGEGKKDVLREVIPRRYLEARLNERQATATMQAHEIEQTLRIEAWVQSIIDLEKEGYEREKLLNQLQQTINQEFSEGKAPGYPELKTAGEIMQDIRTRLTGYDIRSKFEQEMRE